MIDKIEHLCMESQFIYGYRTITRLLKKSFDLVVNRKKVYRIMKEKGWLCRTRPKKTPNLGKPYYVTENQHKVAFYFLEFYQAFSRELLPDGIELSGQAQEDFRSIEELSNSPELIEALKQVRGLLSGGYF
ncbi:transposase [Streptococcus caprae]|uniref:Transposase n=1 Tax=Streptococcus caprae TaxID=1640501 RepID=A0ABV8CXC1_9STRE